MKIKEIDNTEKIIISETNVIPGKIILFILDILLIVINSIIYDFPLFILYNEFLIFFNYLNIYYWYRLFRSSIFYFIGYFSNLYLAFIIRNLFDNSLKLKNKNNKKKI